MPTALHRIQVLMRPTEEALVKTLAHVERRSQSSMAAELIEAALQLPKYKELLDQAITDGVLVVADEDPRERIPQRQFRVYSAG